MNSKPGKLGTFGGVFTPSILTILGIILFRRTGYVVGSAGLAQVLVIILLANAISVLTSLSLGAIATNLRVKGGGDYYLISRTLGVEFGGAIGIILFLAQSVSIAFYCIGFGEALAEILAWSSPDAPRILAGGAVAFLFLFAWVGADWATRLQYVVMTVLGLGLISFFVGGIRHFDPALVADNWMPPENGEGFWLLFALFFPAVTGFTQGVSMSGDLKDPGRSLPLGTLLAVGLSLVVYVCAGIVFAGAQSASSLMADYNAMRQVAVVGALISAGVIAACLSSGMASFLGAPRILQAMAEDRILPRIHFFAKGAGETNNPRRGVLLSLTIALATVALGNLNAIAPVVSMFFLTSYGLLNYATYSETRAASPSFRPRFRWFNQRLSLLGALACLGAMLAIHPTAGIVSISILFALYQYLKRIDSPARWSHGLRSYNFQRIRELLFEMEAEPAHPRDWRPHILAFSQDEPRREQLLRFGSWIEGNSGLTTVVSVIGGRGAAAEAERDAATETLRTSIRNEGVRAFPLAVATGDLRAGLEVLVQSYGVGPLDANVILLNWLDERPRPDPERDSRMYGRYLREAIRLRTNIVVLAATEDEWTSLNQVPADDRRIDVWWGGGASSRLSLLLAYLMTRTRDWEDARLRVLAQGGKKRPERTLALLEEMLKDVRISADTELVDTVDMDTVKARSEGSTLVFMPIMLRGSRPLTFAGSPIDKVLERVPAAALVAAGEDVELDAEPEEGEAGEQAARADKAKDLESDATRREKEAEAAREAAEESRARAADLAAEAPEAEDESALRQARQQAEAAEQEADRLGKRAHTAREAAIDAAKHLEDAANEPTSSPRAESP